LAITYAEFVGLVNTFTIFFQPANSKTIIDNSTVNCLSMKSVLRSLPEFGQEIPSFAGGATILF
jgi:hypothetical protein